MGLNPLLTFPAVLAILLYCIPALAQESLDEVENSISLNSTSGMPLLEKISDKGIYLVQLRWPQLTLDPNNELVFQIFFLNASAPTGANGTIAPPGSNLTKSGTETGLYVPNATESLLPIASYDISIYSGDGRLLWQKTEQPGHGGMPGQRVRFEENYTGSVTIDISNIKPGWGADAATEDMKDSVKFAATVVPEFPLLPVLPAALAFAAIILAGYRLRTK